jgi:Domain of unknown function (DUF4145)
MSYNDIPGGDDKLRGLGTQVTYPNASHARAINVELSLLPARVGRIYNEVRSVVLAQLPIMGGFGLRAIVESVCADKKMSGRNLEEKIDALVDAGLLIPTAAAVLHKLRFMGNSAAHDMKAHSLSDIEAALSVVEILLRQVYVLPRLARKLPKKRAAAKKSR